MKKTPTETESFVHDPNPQEVYDAFNTWIFSTDKKLVAKLYSKFHFLEMVQDIPGDIAELGVFKGSGMAAWMKAQEVLSDAWRTVWGFDIFDASQLSKSLSGQDRSMMDSLFDSRRFDPNNYEEYLKNVLPTLSVTPFQIVKGDVRATLREVLQRSPGLRFSLVNFDLDVAEPTEIALDLIWPRLVPGGILIFDEYAIPEWSESNAVDAFVERHELPIKTTGLQFPSAYVQKPS